MTTEQETVSFTLEQLMNPPTYEEAYESVLELFARLGLTTTNWALGSLTRVTAQFCGVFVRAATLNIAEIARASNAYTARGGWMTLYAMSQYSEARAPATYAVHTLTLTDDGSMVNALTIGPGAFRAETASGLKFASTNTENVVVPVGTVEDDEVTIEVKAESPGTAYNVVDGSITIPTTQHPGLAVDSVLKTQGTNVQSDSALRLQLVRKWSLLSPLLTISAYEYHAIAATSEATRVRVDADAPRGPATIDIYVAGPNGGLSETGVAAVDEYVQARKGDGHDVLLRTATNVTHSTMGTIYYDQSYTLEDAQSAIIDAARAWYEEQPIGGRDLEDGGPSKIWMSQLNAHLQGTDEYGVANAPAVVLSNLSEDLTMTKNQVAVPDLSGITWTPTTRA